MVKDFLENLKGRIILINVGEGSLYLKLTSICINSKFNLFINNGISKFEYIKQNGNYVKVLQISLI